MAVDLTGLGPTRLPIRRREDFARPAVVVYEEVTAVDQTSALASFVDSVSELMSVGGIQEASDASFGTVDRSEADVSNLGPLRTPIKRRVDFSRTSGQSDSTIEAAAAVDSASANVVTSDSTAETTSASDASNSDFGVIDRSSADVSALGPIRTPIRRRTGFVRGTEVVEVFNASDTASAQVVAGVSVVEVLSVIDVITAQSVTQSDVVETTTSVDETDVATIRTTADVSSVGPLGMPKRKYESFSRESVSETTEIVTAVASQDAVVLRNVSSQEVATGIDSTNTVGLFVDTIAEVTTSVATQDTTFAFGSGVVEVTTTTDTTTVNTVNNVVVVESSNSTDISEGNPPGQTSGSVEESSIVSDVVSSLGLFGSVVAESTPLIETTNTSGDLNVDVAEATTLVDVTDSFGNVTEGVVETTSAISVEQAAKHFLASVLNVALLIDGRSALKELSAVRSEFVTLADYSAPGGMSVVGVEEFTDLLGLEEAFAIFMTDLLESVVVIDNSNAGQIVAGVNDSGDRTLVLDTEIREYEVPEQGPLVLV